MTSERREESQFDEWRKHWPPVVASFLGLSFASVLFQAIGLFIAPLQQEFGWTRTQVTAGTSVAAIVMVPLTPFVGACIDRWGARRVAIPGLILTMFSIASLSLTNGASFQWLVLWSFYGVVASALNTTLWTCVVLDTFKTGRSLAMSAVLSGATFAGAAGPPMTQWLTDSFGWRAAFLSLGLGWGGAALALALLCIPHRTTTSREIEAQPTTELPGLSLHQAARSAPLLRIGLATLIIMTLGSALVVHRVPILTDAGVSRATAAQVAALSGVMGVVGKLVMGWAMQRWDAGVVGGVSIGALGAALVLLLEPLRSAATVVLATAMIGFAGGAKLQIAAYLTSVYAGARNFGKIFGVMAGVIAVATGLGPVLGGLAFDATQDYSLLIWAGFPCCLLGTALLVRLGPRPPWDVAAPVGARSA